MDPLSFFADTGTDPAVFLNADPPDPAAFFNADHSGSSLKNFVKNSLLKFLPVYSGEKKIKTLLKSKISWNWSNSTYFFTQKRENCIRKNAFLRQKSAEGKPGLNRFLISCRIL